MVQGKEIVQNIVIKSVNTFQDIAHASKKHFFLKLSLYFGVWEWTCLPSQQMSYV